MALAVSQHFYFRSANGRYRAHVGAKGALVMASCQGVARLKMDTQKLMVERKHFGLKFHLLPNSREMVELILFTNRAEVKEVRLKVDGEVLPAVSEKIYRADGDVPALDPGAATLVQPPPGTGLASDLGAPSSLPIDPEKDDVLDRLALLTGSGKHPAVGRISETVTLPVNLPPAEALRIDPATDMVPPIPEDVPTPAYSIPAVNAGSKIEPQPSRKTKPARSGKEPAAKSAVQSSPAGSKITAAASPPAAKSPPAPSVGEKSGAQSGVDPAVKPNKNAVAPDGDLKVPEGLDDLLDLDEGKGKK